MKSIVARMKTFVGVKMEYAKDWRLSAAKWYATNRSNLKLNKKGQLPALSPIALIFF